MYGKSIERNLCSDKSRRLQERKLLRKVHPAYPVKGLPFMVPSIMSSGQTFPTTSTSIHQCLLWTSEDEKASEPGGVQETLRCCTEGYGLVRNIGGRWMVGLHNVGDLCQPW